MSNDKVNQHKNLILKESYLSVPFDGWSDRNLEVICLKLNFDKNYGQLLFPQGIIELVDYFWATIDLELISAAQDLPLTDYKIREIIFKLVKLHLTLGNKQRNLQAQTRKFYNSPKYKLAWMKKLWHTADHIWYLAGDNSTDHNYYSKRLLLSRLYNKVLEFFINDQSENYQESWDFLRQNIEDIINLGKLPSKVTATIKTLPFIRLVKW